MGDIFIPAAASDVFVALMVGAIALCLFRLHTVTSRSFPNWPNLPDFIRHGLLVAGGLFMVRSVNLLSLAKIDDPGAAGRTNLWAVVATIALTYLVASFTIWLSLERLDARSWARLEWLHALLRRNPDVGLVPLRADEAAAVGRADGMVALAPGAKLDEFPAAVAAQHRRRA